MPLWIAQDIPIVAVSRYVGYANPTITLGTSGLSFLDWWAGEKGLKHKTDTSLMGVVVPDLRDR